MPTPIARWDPVRSVWETAQALICGHSAAYSETLPSWGSMRGGELFELPTPALPTDAPGSSSLPTPRATDGTKGGPNQRGSKGDLMLPSAVMQLPTPRATRGGSATETVYLLPSPRTSDTNGPGAHGTGGPDLRTVVSLLPTPAVNDMGAGKTVEAWDEWTEKMRSKHGNGNGHGPSLSIEALRLVDQDELWDT